LGYNWGTKSTYPNGGTLHKKPKNPYTTKHDRLSDSRCDVLSSSLETRPEPDGTRRRSTAVDDGIEIDPEGEFATKVKEDLAAKIKSFASMMMEKKWRI
jgi:hypothetical protein